MAIVFMNANVPTPSAEVSTGVPCNHRQDGWTTYFSNPHFHEHPSIRSIMNRLLGLDTIRFFAALWVVMRHGAMPPLTSGFGKGAIASQVDLAWRGAISGPAAVIVFFIVSGFCIHLPYANGKPFDLGEYLIRRFVRLLLPMFVALTLWRLFHGMDDFGKDWLGGIPAWSIVAELVYYALYPFLRLVPRRPWKTIFVLTFVGALVFASLAQSRTNINYPAWGYHLDWLLGLPVWILGVVLADSRIPLPSPPTWRIWTERGIAVFLGGLTTWLAWQRILGHHLTLNVLALFAVWWIRDELGYHRDHAPSPLFERLGLWCYSMYLTHPLALAIWASAPVPYFGHVADWGLKLSFTLLLAGVFHIVCERPAHQLAQRLARAWTSRQADFSCSMPMLPNTERTTETRTPWLTE